ncbi:MAG TPA: Uma2 family endonuclease [Planctomycetota bacterium]|nr:Uma2 family endonuclease [Planctomycetota bacterium]
MRTDIKITYEHYSALPEGPPHYQLIDGDLTLSPSPNFHHQELIGTLYFELRAFNTQHKLGVVALAPLDVVLSDVDVLQPDILFVANARKKIIRKEGVFGAPDLCIEILSPSNRKLDLGIKRQLYARHGVIEYWIVDPDDNTVSVYRLQEETEQPRAKLDDRATLTSALLPGFELKLERLFAK